MRLLGTGMYQVQEVEYMEASLERQLRSGGTSKYLTSAI